MSNAAAASHVNGPTRNVEDYAGVVKGMMRRIAQLELAVSDATALTAAATAQAAADTAQAAADAAQGDADDLGLVTVDLAADIAALDVRITALEGTVSAFPNIAFGTVTGTTNAASNLQWAHGLPWTPIAVVVSPVAPNGAAITDRFTGHGGVTFNSTVVNIGRCIAQDGSALTSTSVTVRYIAIG